MLTRASLLAGAAAGARAGPIPAVVFNHGRAYEKQLAALGPICNQRGWVLCRTLYRGRDGCRRKSGGKSAQTDHLHDQLDSAGAAQTWAESEVRELMTRSVRKARVPILFLQAENDWDLGPSRTLSAAAKSAGKCTR